MIIYLVLTKCVINSFNSFWLGYLKIELCDWLHEVLCSELLSFYGKQYGRFHNTYLASMLTAIIFSIVIVLNHNFCDI